MVSRSGSGDEPRRQGAVVPPGVDGFSDGYGARVMTRAASLAV
jgi:hypothetical protein